MRLSCGTLDAIAPAVARWDYDRAAQRRGIVHLGLGAFHRAHQAVYTDTAMSAGDRDWAITGISLRSAAVRDRLAPQDGLYTVTERGADGDATRLIGAVSGVIVASEDGEAVTRALADPDTHIVSLTVTEKTYRRRADGSLDVDAVLGDPGSLYHRLADGFRARMAAGAGGQTIVCCDNLANNGRVVSALIGEWLEAHAPDLAAWFARECACPSTMVDRIVPATSANDLADVARRVGVEDQGAVVTEPFRQWVIEDRFAGPRPRWEVAGAQIVADVRPFESAKLRMLNGAHSALAYLGLLGGHAFVHEAVADPRIRPIVERLMWVEAAATIDPAPGQDLQSYAGALLHRFANAALPHRLRQIATDGSAKIGQRWLDPIARAAREERESPATLTALAAWMLHVRGDREAVDDPLASTLAAAWVGAGEAGIVGALFGDSGPFAACWAESADRRAFVSDRICALERGNFAIESA